ncbi:YncE family protein [Xanthobacter sp. KR7-65]|uniref:YncE family protein n=1 Tax=Xanthobacter sp. KR7-65 TaxID=3156612 RepID=UPI0032B59859
MTLHRNALAALLLVIVLAGAGEGQAAALYVVCQAGAEVDVIDTDASAVTHRIAVAKGPAGIALAPDGMSAYVTHPDAGLLTRIDAARRQVAGTVRLGGQPFGVAADPASGAIYVGDWSADRITRLDPVSLEPTGVVGVGRAPAALATDPRARRLYSADREDDAVSIIDLATFTRIARVAVGTAPYALDAEGDATVVAVADVRSGDVALIGKADGSVTRIGGMRMPYGVAFVPGRRLLLVSDQQAEALHLLDPDGKETLAKVRLGGSPEGVVADRSGGRAYVAEWFANRVAVVDLETRALATRIDVCDGPRMMVLGP